MFFKEETKGKINGAILGMEFEWFAHNVTYQRLSALNHLGINDLYGRDMDKLMDQAKDVDLGKTKFDDDHGWIRNVMKGVCCVENPVGIVIDLLIWWWNK